MGRSPRGGLTTKIHALVGAEGSPVRLHRPEGQQADCTQVDPLLDTLTVPSNTIVLADKVYDTDAIRWKIRAAGNFRQHSGQTQPHVVFCFQPVPLSLS